MIYYNGMNSTKIITGFVMMAITPWSFKHTDIKKLGHVKV